MCEQLHSDEVIFLIVKTMQYKKNRHLAVWRESRFLYFTCNYSIIEVFSTKSIMELYDTLLKYGLKEMLIFSV